MRLEADPPQPKPSRPWFALLRSAAVAFFLLVSVAGCTAGFVYDRLDWLVSWYVNGLVSLDNAQEEQLRTSVQQTLAWHRETQLTRYTAFLQDLSTQMQGPVTAEIMEQRYQEMANLLDDTIERVVTEAAGLLETLRDDQVAELMASLEEDNEDLWEEYAGATPEIRQKRRLKSALRFLQRFTGRLSVEQRALVELRLTGMQDNSEAWLERRRQWQGRLFSLLRERPPGRDLEAALRDMALNPDQFDSAGYRRQVEDNRRIIMGMLAEVINGLNPRQRGHLVGKINEYSDALREISERG